MTAPMGFDDSRMVVERRTFCKLIEGAHRHKTNNKDTTDTKDIGPNQTVQDCLPYIQHHIECTAGLGFDECRNGHHSRPVHAKPHQKNEPTRTFSRTMQCTHQPMQPEINMHDVAESNCNAFRLSCTVVLYQDCFSCANRLQNGPSKKDSYGPTIAAN